MTGARSTGAAGRLRPGRVVRVERRFSEVAVDGRVVLADAQEVSSPDPLTTVCTGDWAVVELPATDGADGTDGAAGGRGRTAGPSQPVLRALLPRRTAFVRSTSSKRSEGQVVAANLDAVLVVVSLAVDPRAARVERLLALAWESGATPVVVLTKADTVDDAEQIHAEIAATAPGVQVLTVSARTGDGLDVLGAVLAGVAEHPTAALVGQSGAGKSTLANALLGAEVLATGAERSDGKGRHTTVRRELHVMPADGPVPGGGVLIDTPGLRGVGLYDSADGLRQVFAEIAELATGCRFGDCGHQGEPGCAVLAAVEDGTLARRRLDSYRKLLREEEWIASRSDARLRAERERQWKVIHKSVRAAGYRQDPRRR
ncbi:ribosome small subunit-dependent GTPase A [Allostreptomyces psammosilenae]|uniref:ribosome small subunit-dependent GTPase A n=1 Tax=Allostreptomyces psammosilenae TaxID=1892865 RepID=UPI0015CC38EE|nr:ribosome small subunit-dependent GTPase A [Allostreptomyces psammosilenae]